MNEGNLCKSIKLLYTRISRDLNKNISPKKCNDYVHDLESLKDEIYDLDYDWIEDYEEVEEVNERGFFSDDADETEIHETLEETLGQLDRMHYHMGIDVSDYSDVNRNNGNIPSININVSPTVTASANSQVSMEVKQEVDRLVKDFEEEYQRPFPDKSKLEKIIKTLNTLGPYAITFVSKLTGLLEKLW